LKKEEQLLLFLVSSLSFKLIYINIRANINLIKLDASLRSEGQARAYRNRSLGSNQMSSSLKERETSTPNPSETGKPLPQGLRNVMLILLVGGVAIAVLYAYIRQSSVKPIEQNAALTCDPVTENRLRETLAQNRSDFITLVEWGYYNFDCLSDAPASLAAFQQASRIADEKTGELPLEQRLEAYNGLGRAYLESNLLKEGETQFRKILQLDPTNLRARISLGASLARTDPNQAIQIWQAIINENPNTEVARSAQQLIDTLKGVLEKPTVTPTARR
jgi:cytochrome c-type biogenesis protein CcmH/NrfG